MVVSGRCPSGGGVAGAASRAKAALVSIIPSMAGITVAGYAMQNMINVATITGNRDMFACQFEC